MHRLKVFISTLVMLATLLGCSVFFLVPAVANEKKDYQMLELFTDVLSIIRKSYVEETDTTELIYGAIRGMLSTLDPHSSFLSAEMYQDMKDDTHGEFGGLGIEITKKDGLLLVVSPIEDTPAFKAGIKAGDQILKIEDTPTKDLEIMEAVRLLRGPKGAEVTIKIWRESFSEPQDFTLVRDRIQLHSVKSKFLLPGIAYARVSQFQVRTGSDLQDELQKRIAENGGPLQGLVLDLRNNPGGLLDQAVAVSDLFLSDGLIVYTEGREEGSQLQFRATSEGTESDYPIVVLINGGSASAAEIVSGALKDHGRAVLLGERTFGKGSVQSVIPMSDDTGLRLTTARYYTPNGISIQARGILPDIEVTQQHNGMLQENHQLREKDLENHFRPLKNSQPVQEESEGQVEFLEEHEKNDNQLMRALDLLKGLNILQYQRKAA
ncbi:carboxyl-terminal processing protease [Malonomonas rubra DSM 5091]|uniref:Carboxyl-terminal processing protease n=1 Tax=Malonomonas rubra DSM 5091 TaxID=1122189 RepID=A0A1M6BBX4_MALRU|nr:S41 family peptidase [Malonomonas rubra]SHI46222.1 carboxyl-terminal processing protease [Malonomonas rubra DSM 5091]